MRIAIALLALLAALATSACVDATPEETVDSISTPPWAERSPSASDYRNVYPLAAYNAGVSGEATLICRIQPDRTLECGVENESPADMEFGKAALVLSRAFVVRIDPVLKIGSRIRFRTVFQH